MARRKGNGKAAQVARRSPRSRLRAAIEPLEDRLLLSTATQSGDYNYLVTATTLSVSAGANPISGSPFNLAGFTEVDLTGGPSSNSFTVTGYSGLVKIDGAGGGDTFTINTGAGGTVDILSPSGGSSVADTIIIHSPSLTPATTTVTPGSITVGSDTINNADANVTNLSLVGQLSGSGDGLIVNGTTTTSDSYVLSGSTLSATGEPQITYNSYTSLTINASGATESFTVNGINEPTTLDAGAGNANFLINSNNESLTLNSGISGSDTFVINGNSGTLIANGSGANDQYTVNNSASGMTLNGGSGVNIFTVKSNSAMLDLNGGSPDTSDTFDIKSNSGTIDAVGGSGTDSFEVDGTTAPITLQGGAGNDTFHVTAPTYASITVVGGSGTIQSLEFDGSPVTDNIIVTGTEVTGLLSPLYYSGLTSLTVNGGGGADTFTVESDSAPTTLIGSVDNDVFNIQADSTSDPVTVDTGSGASTINLGSVAPSNFSKLDTLKGGVVINGDGSDTLNMDDSGSSTHKTGTLSGGDLSGFSPGDLQYNGIGVLNLLLGSGGNTLTITGTTATTTNINTGSGNDLVYVQDTGGTTNINTGAGNNVVDVGSTAPAANGTLTFIQGALTITGNGADLLNLDDSGSSSSKTGTLNATTVSGLSPANITYSGIATLTVKLGNKGNHFTITTTNAATTTNIDGGTGGDTITLLADAGKTNIAAGSGSNTISVDSTGGATTVTDSAGTSSILVGSTEPTAGGLLSGIQSTLGITGNSKDTVTLDDSGDTSATTNGVLAANALTGLGMGTTGVTFSGIGTLNVDLGSGGNTFLITGTSASISTVINSGSGNDVVTLQNDQTPTTINSDAGNDAIDVQGTDGATTVNAGSGTDTVYVSNNAPSAGDLQLILAQLTINGTSSTTATLDDTGNPLATTGTLSATELTGTAPAAILYSGLGTLNLKLGTGGNTLTVTGTSAKTTNINSGAGIDVINVNGTGASTATNINTGGGTNINSVNVGDPGSNVSAILGSLAITGDGHDLLNIDNADSATPNTATLTSTSLTGLTTDPITWSGINIFSLSLGTKNNQLTVNSTITGNSTINGGPNTDIIDLLNENGPVTVNTGTGNDTVYIPVTNAAVTVNDSGGADNINVGSNSPPSSGVLSGIKSALTITGDGSDTVNLDDSGDTGAKTVQITAGAVSGLSPVAIDYATVGTLNVYLGSAVDTVNIPSTSAATNVFTGAEADTINVGTGGLTSGINGPVTITGTANADILNVDDSADPSSATGSLTGSLLTGASPSPISYAGIKTLTISLGTGGNNFTITNTNAGTTTTLNSGTGNDTVTLATDSGPTTINTQAGSDTVYVQGTGAATTINTGTPGSDTIDVGSVLPPPLFNSGVLSGVQGKLTVNGSGDDTLNLDDSGDSASHSAGLLTPTALTGLGAAEIDFSKLGALSLALGTGNNTLTVTNTASGTTTAITTAGGSDVINIQATSSPLSATTAGGGVNTFNLGSKAPATGGIVDGLVGAVTLTGDGSDIANVDDTGSSAARTAVLSNTTLTLGPASIGYSGLAALNVNLGTGKDTFKIANTASGTTTTVKTTVSDTFNVQGISSPTTISTGTSGSTINVGSTAPTAGGIVDGIQGALAINGASTGTDTLNVDDTGSTGPKTGALSSTALTGLSMSSGITYSGVTHLTVSLGSGGNTFAINSTNAATNTTLNSGAGNDTVTLVSDSGPTTLNTQGGADTVYVNATGGTTNVNTGTGTDVVTVGSLAPATGGTLNNIKGALTITADPTTLNLDDSGSTTTKTATVTGSAVSGLSPVAIKYSGVVGLNIGLGSGGDTVNVTSTSASGGTVVTGGSGSETFNLTSAASTGLQAQLLGPVTLDGGSGGNDKLIISDSLDKTGRTVNVSANTITGLGKTITYLDQSSLSLLLTPETDTLTVTGANPTTATTINGGGGTSAGTLDFPGDFNGMLLVQGALNTVTIGGSMSGSLTTTLGITTMTVGGNLNGTLNVQSSITTLAVGGNLAGAVNVTSKLGTLTFGGNQTGTITAGSVGTIGVSAAAAESGGAVLSITQGGKLRQVIATNASTGNPLSNATFKLLYDGATLADPQVAVRATNTGGSRFDLLLSSPVGANFDLSRLDGSSTAPINVRNVTVEGNILATVSSPEASYMGLAGGSIGGVYLPADSVAAVSTWGNLPSGTIRVTSIEGIAFATLTNGKTTYSASSMTTQSSEATLLTALAANSTAKKLTYYEAVALPTETLRVAFSTKAAVSLFVDGTRGTSDSPGLNLTTNNGGFEESGLAFADQETGTLASAPVTALASFTSNSSKHTTDVSQLSFVGDGGSVNSVAGISNITSTGALGNLYLQGDGTASAAPVTLNSVTAPSIFGSINLYGGTLSGTIQTTGVRYDPVTGAAGTVAADLGATTPASGTVTGVTSISLNMAAGSRIISRGNLFSQVTISGALLGTIAAQGNIGAGIVSSGKLTRFGGITIGAGVSTGDIVALGNIFGNIAITGSFAGRIAAQGSAISGLAATRIGILGNVTLTGGLAAGGAVISSGLIGDSVGGTKLTLTAAADQGFVAAKGAITASATLPSGHVFQNLTGVNAAAIAAIWTNGGASLSLDISSGDLGGLALILNDAIALKVVSGSLTGTIA